MFNLLFLGYAEQNLSQIMGQQANNRLMAYLKGVSPKKKHRFSIKQCKERKENIMFQFGHSYYMS
jgi:hypothetical protein